MSFLHTLSVLTLLVSAPLLIAAGCSASVHVPFTGVVNAGGRPIGASCAFDNQCAHGRCSADLNAGTCGQCVTIEALGHSCTGAHQGCSISAVCKDGVCQSLRKVKGEACTLGGGGTVPRGCDVELFCARASDWNGNFSEPGHCIPLTRPGKSCAETLSRCGWGAVCNQDKVCEIPASVPGSCTAKHQCAHDSFCGDDHFCHPGTLPQNAACPVAHIQTGHIYNECAHGLACGSLEYPNGGYPLGTKSTCVPVPNKGEPCIHGACSDGLFCVSSPTDGRLPYCDTFRGEGEACSNRNNARVLCSAGLECRGNTCRVPCE